MLRKCRDKRSGSISCSRDSHISRLKTSTKLVLAVVFASILLALLGGSGRQSEDGASEQDPDFAAVANEVCKPAKRNRHPGSNRHGPVDPDRIRMAMVTEGCIRPAT